MSRIGVVASSQLAADAGAEIARGGGNAVDACVASVLVSMVTEPGVCALGGGGYVILWPPGGDPVTIDGNVAMPGHGLPRSRLGKGCKRVRLEYGGGVETLVGPGTAATPGGLAALGVASNDYGRLPWEQLVEPARRLADEGFPLSQASNTYLDYSGDPIFSASPDGREAIFHPDGRLKQAGDRVRVPHLADSLGQIAEQGIGAFYGGPVGAKIVSYLQDNEGLLTTADLLQYQPVKRPALELAVDEWSVATNPPPAIGGATLAAMIILMGRHDIRRWGPHEVRLLAEVQAAVLDYRRRRLDLSADLEADASSLVEACLEDRFAQLGQLSPSTVHTSAADSRGLVCAATMSSGYGSGVMPPETGIWLNNSLGEIELNCRGFEVGPPGTRLPSNMAPTVARRADGAVLAIGSPGADRITTAILQTLINHLHLGLPLQEAVERPRVHIDMTGAGPVLACEPGLPVEEVPFPVRHFEEISMYFGGVGAVHWDPIQDFVSGADPRRTGGKSLAGEDES